MKCKTTMYILLSGLILLTACGAPADGDSQPAPPPTTAPAGPTTELISLPTATPKIPPTATPENQLFRDDFSGELQPGWTWENENADRWTFTKDGWLEIIGEDASLLAGGRQSNLLWRALPGGDFVITVHLIAQPIVNFQQATLYIYEDQDNYIALNRGFCDLCLDGGGAFFMEYQIGGATGAYNKGTDRSDVYIRLTREGDVISGFYAYEPDQWERIGRFGGAYFDFTRFGIGVTNVDGRGIDADLVGQFDFIEVTKP